MHTQSTLHNTQPGCTYRMIILGGHIILNKEEGGRQTDRQTDRQIGRGRFPFQFFSVVTPSSCRRSRAPPPQLWLNVLHRDQAVSHLISSEISCTKQTPTRHFLGYSLALGLLLLTLRCNAYMYIILLYYDNQRFFNSRFDFRCFDTTSSCVSLLTPPNYTMQANFE